MLMVMSGSRLTIRHKLPQGGLPDLAINTATILIEINAVNGDQHGKNDSQLSSSHSQPRFQQAYALCLCPYLCAGIGSSSS
ncbi:hypothetical protein ACNKHV_00960 [Shigella flexneri]